MKKYKVFVGGNYSGDAETRGKIAIYGQRINKAVIDCGFEPSLNLLGNTNVFKGAKAENVKFENGRFFLDVGGETISKTKKEMQEVSGLRSYASQEEFEICYMAANIAFNELEKSIAGIFELSAVSQGSYLEIGLMIYHLFKPVICLSHESFGRPFGTMLTGSKSLFLKTIRYNDENLEQIIKDFLLRDLKERLIKSITYRIPVFRDIQMKEIMKKQGYTNISDFVRDIVEKHIKENL